MCARAAQRAARAHPAASSAFGALLAQTRREARFSLLLPLPQHTRRQPLRSCTHFHYSSVLHAISYSYTAARVQFSACAALDSRRLPQTEMRSARKLARSHSLTHFHDQSEPYCTSTVRPCASSSVHSNPKFRFSFFLSFFLSFSLSLSLLLAQTIRRL